MQDVIKSRWGKHFLFFSSCGLRNELASEWVRCLFPSVWLCVWVWLFLCVRVCLRVIYLKEKSLIKFVQFCQIILQIRNKLHESFEFKILRINNYCKFSIRWNGLEYKLEINWTRSQNYTSDITCNSMNELNIFPYTKNIFMYRCVFKCQQMVRYPCASF